MRADTYYGKRASGYDAARCHSLRWAKEQIAVSDFVFSGPVLDCPIGTARFAGIYRDKGLDVVGVDISPDMLAEAKRKYPDLDARQGTIFELPFPQKHFATVVSTRLLDWLPPDEMIAAVKALRRMANIVVVSIRHGPEDCRVNYTHSLARFYEAIDGMVRDGRRLTRDGLFICERRVTEVTNDGRDVEEIFRLRPPLWSDVVKQFQHHGHTPAHEMDRLACPWVGHINLREDTAFVSAEYWTGEDLGAVIDDMAAEHDHLVAPVDRYVTDLEPRFDHAAPVTVLSARGRRVALDGRRRINKWRKTSGRYPVLVIEER